MSRGFITLGINTDLDKIQYCYALALSIKNSNPDEEVCLVVDKGKENSVPQKYFHAFDYITELPFGNTAFMDGFHGSNVWQVYHCTPFEETIYLDYDTVFFNVDTDLLWDQFENYEIAIPTFARTYRNTIANKTVKFEIEAAYRMPALYNQLIYFKQTGLAKEWFKMADPIFQNWREAYKSVFTDRAPDTFNKNILCNLVTHSLDCVQDVAVSLNNFYDLSTDSQNLWNEDTPKQWTTVLNSWYNRRNGLLIENSLIRSGIVHYCDEDFITKEILDDFRNTFNTTVERRETA